MSAGSLDLWLIRTHKNEVLGPVPKEEIIARIRDRRLGPEDEVCQANHYWIYLDERDEVSRQLGIEMPRSNSKSGRDDDEITLTETAEVEPGHEMGAAGGAGGAARGAGSYVPSSKTGSEGERGSLSPSTMANSQDLARLKGGSSGQRKPVVVGKAEGNIWRLMGTLLVVVTSALVIWLIRILQTAK